MKELAQYVEQEAGEYAAEDAVISVSLLLVLHFVVAAVFSLFETRVMIHT